jgi:hypothetical protein
MQLPRQSSAHQESSQCVQLTGHGMGKAKRSSQKEDSSELKLREVEKSQPQPQTRGASSSITHEIRRQKTYKSSIPEKKILAICRPDNPIQAQLPRQSQREVRARLEKDRSIEAIYTSLHGIIPVAQCTWETVCEARSGEVQLHARSKLNILLRTTTNDRTLVH